MNALYPLGDCRTITPQNDDGVCQNSHVADNVFDGMVLWCYLTAPDTVVILLCSGVM